MSPHARTLSMAGSLLVAAALVLVACGGDGSNDGTATAQAAISPTAIRVTPPPTVPPPSPTPTLPAGVSDEPVRFESGDAGTTVQGHLFTSAGPLRKVVVFAHAESGDQGVWRGLAQGLAAQGIHALTFDFPGFGETGGARNLATADQDIEIAIQFLSVVRDYPLIYLIGEGAGGTAALRVAARQDVAGVITVSAPVEFIGLDARADLARVTAPKLFVATRGDANGAYVTQAEQLLAASPAPKETLFYDGAQHGAAILDGPFAADFRAKVMAFLGAP